MNLFEIEIQTMSNFSIMLFKCHTIIHINKQCLYSCKSIHLPLAVVASQLTPTSTSAPRINPLTQNVHAEGSEQ